MIGMDHTRKLYQEDMYMKEFEAEVVSVSDDGKSVVLDATAFAPDAGGQSLKLSAASKTMPASVVLEMTNSNVATWAMAMNFSYSSRALMTESMEVMTRFSS